MFCFQVLWGEEGIGYNVDVAYALEKATAGACGAPTSTEPNQRWRAAWATGSLNLACKALAFDDVAMHFASDNLADILIHELALVVSDAIRFGVTWRNLVQPCSCLLHFVHCCATAVLASFSIAPLEKPRLKCRAHLSMPLVRCQTKVLSTNYRHHCELLLMQMVVT
jgi:hypothetical protein